MFTSPNRITLPFTATPQTTGYNAIFSKSYVSPVFENREYFGTMYYLYYCDSGTTCRHTSYNKTCRVTSNTRWRRFYCSCGVQVRFTYWPGLFLSVYHDLISITVLKHYTQHILLKNTNSKKNTNELHTPRFLNW